MPTFAPDTIFSVSEFLDFTNQLFKPIEVSVRGEITSVSRRASATYFSLSDKKENAKLECLVWSAKLRAMNIDLAEGMEIQVLGTPNIYKPFGKFSFVANQISPVGEGALKQAFEKLKQKLEGLGYFTPERKKPLPKYVRKIGVITSQYGDALNDFKTHLGRYGFSIQLIDARVEGLKAISSITSAIAWFNQHPSDIDVLVLTRGGGSLESLQAFNSEEVARAIFGSRIPIISAVGHENDVTIADFVADLRASTPTDAGKILSKNWLLLEQTLLQSKLSMISSAERIFFQQKRMIDQHGLNLLSGLRRILEKYASVFTRFEQTFAAFQRMSTTQRTTLATSVAMLIREFQRQLTLKKTALESQEVQLRLADPAQKLQQGYSIVRTAAGKLLRDYKQIKIGDTISVTIQTATLKSSVTTIQPEHS